MLYVKFKIQGETLVPVSFFKFRTLGVQFYLKRELHHMHFPVNFVTWTVNCWFKNCSNKIMQEDSLRNKHDL